MKRSANGNVKPTTKPRPNVPDYCDVEPLRDEQGNAIWPASEADIEKARSFIWECAKAQKRTLLVPDKDADGLSAGVILYWTLTALGLPESLIDVHFVQKGSNIHEPSERTAVAAKDPTYIVVLDQGSVGGPAIIDSETTRSLILDHHLSTSFPDRATVVSACHYPPVATTSLLTYEICKPLSPTLSDSAAYLACIGTHGDLGNTLKWTPPFPSMLATFKQHTKKAINDAVSLINAPRRTAEYDVASAWTALLSSTSPKDILTNPRLRSARAAVNAEVERCTHAAPRFSADGKIAVLRIASPAQVHPVIATRWAGHLRSATLEIVLVANAAYLPGAGLVNFSCRVARCARARDPDHPPVNIIAALHAAARLGPDPDGLVGRLGPSFARGHREASGGVVPVEAFEELMTVLGVGERKDVGKQGGGSGSATSPEKNNKKAKTISPQKNTLGNYFVRVDS